MPGAVKETNIEEIAGMLVEHRSQGKHPILFLGARAGGVFRNAYLYETLKQFSLLNFDKLSGAEQFRECYRVLTSKYFDEITRHEILVNALGPLTYRHEDRLLSGLVKAGFFKAIITTNIDMLLEDAFSSWGMRESGDYRVYKPGVSDIGDLTHEKMEERYIVKVFGDLNSWSYRVGSSSTGLDEGLTRFLDSKLSEDVVVIGYDPVWDRTVERAFREKGGILWYVNEEQPAKNSHLAYVLDQRRVKFLLGPQGRYRYFLRELYNYLGGEASLKPEAVASPSTPSSQSLVRKNAFISYSHNDKAHLERLWTHLKGYLHTGSEKEDVIDVWDDTKIVIGRDWKKEISDALAKARVAVLLVSADFMGSDFIRQYELPPLLQAAQNKEILLIPVVLSPCAFSYTPLATYQAIHPKPLLEMSWTEQETVWTNVAEKMYKILNDQI